MKGPMVSFNLQLSGVMLITEHDFQAGAFDCETALIVPAIPVLDFSDSELGDTMEAASDGDSDEEGELTDKDEEGSTV